MLKSSVKKAKKICSEERSRGPFLLFSRSFPASRHLSGISFYAGRYLEAEPLIKRALAISEKALGLNSQIGFLFDYF